MNGYSVGVQLVINAWEVRYPVPDVAGPDVAENDPPRYGWGRDRIHR